MTCFYNSFCKHPHEVGMTYMEHMFFSCNLSVRFFCASIQACIHSIFPSLFETSSTDYANNISEIIESVHI